MPQEDRPLYSRGQYRLQWDRRADGSLRSPFLQIVWYDAAARRNRSASTGTGEIAAAEAALDRLYLERERGERICPTCGQPTASARGKLLTEAISDYLTLREDRPSIDSIRPRLAHVVTWLERANLLDLECDAVTAERVAEFRNWAGKVPVIEAGVSRKRAPGTIEASVVALKAAINAAYRRGDALRPAQFMALPPRDVSRTPTYRADLDTLAAMFRYCLRPSPPPGEQWSVKMIRRQIAHRANLLRFLQGSVATWARPDAVLDISTAPERDQWISAARVLRLNPRGRRQTTKHRPEIVVPARFAAILDATDGFLIPRKSVRKAFEAMLDELGLPRDRETGTKLIRRSVSQLARQRIGEANWAQGKMMLGHQRHAISDLYALPDPANLGLALAATDWIIDEIEARCSGAFTGDAPEMVLLAGAKNG